MEYFVNVYNGDKWLTKVFTVVHDENFGYMYKYARKNGKWHLGAKPIKDGFLIRLDDRDVLLQRLLYI